MQLGHAAGLAAAARRNIPLPDVPLRQVQDWLQEDDVSLDPNDPRFPQGGS